MSKFIFKFYILFIIAMSVVFFSLITFQKYTMDKEIHQMQYQRFNMENFNQFPPYVQKKDPPVLIPVLLLLTLSSIFILCILKYIDKNFITPLDLIKQNIKKVANGSFDVIFESTSENSSLQETLHTLNNMVQGLKEKEKLQDNFIQNLVHDLRAPILAQERAINILTEEFNNHELLTGMAENNEKYLQMINSIIEVYKNKEFRIDKITVNLYDLCNTIINALHPIAEGKKITIKTDITKGFIIWADYISLNRIIMNLVSNAIENIKENSNITISAIKNQYTTIIEVKDDGQGINQENINHIFDKYSSGKSYSNKIVSGLGLAIVKELTEKNNGKIRVESEINEYTKFIIELPNKG